MILNLYFFQISMSTGVDRVSGYIVSLFVLILYTLMVHKQEIYRYRRIFFITVTLLFFPSFINNLVEARGQMGLTESDIIKNEVPFCHIVIPLTTIPYALTKTIIFPARLFNHYASVYSMLLIWLLATVTMGRGWCSWVCFYGGWDELSSSIPGKRRVKLSSNGPFARYFNFSMLVAMVLLSLKSFSVVYCEWFCPFKLVTENSGVESVTAYLQFVLMVILFFGLLVALPYFTRTRFQCATFCPFGAFQSFFSRFSPFGVYINKEKCNSCGTCQKLCPTLSISDSSLQSGKPHITCTLCGRCVERCPKGAITLRFKWLKNELLPTLLSPVTFLAFIGMFLGSLVGGGFMKSTISMVLGG